MGSFPVEGCNKGIDTSVGGLVWVRRRNGSWWPGRIMGLDELPESCLVSPKAGTPVKLLGRIDASIDWYNLEKSKRVKAFRCGEYDDCITKAKITAAHSNKKAAKYARREDAILHALELESAHLGKDRPDFSSRMDCSAREHRNLVMESANTVSHSGKRSDDISNDASECGVESDSAIELSQSGISFEEPNQVVALKARSVPGRRRTPNDSEDDGVEGTKRMRGLVDLGMGVLSDKKMQDAGALECIRQGDASTFGSKTGNCIDNGINGIRGYSTSKRKRSQVPHVQEFLKKKNRRRPLTKVLESTSMVSVPVICDQFANSSGSSLVTVSASKLSGLESSGSKQSLPTVVSNNSDSTVIPCEDISASNAAEHASNGDHVMCEKKDDEGLRLQELAERELSEKLYDVPLVGDEHHSRGVSYCSGRTISGSETRSGQLNHVEVLSLQHEISNELGSGGLGVIPFDNMSHRMHRGGSRWHSKGKRNSRHTNRSRKLELRENMDVYDESNTYLAGPGPSDGFSRGSDRKVDCNVISNFLASYNSTYASKSRSIATNQVDRVGIKSKPISHYTRRPSTAVKQLDNGSSTPQICSKSKTANCTARYLGSDIPLYDVELEVKASYKPQHVVPLVSLMSKLNGKAIVGYPLTVEVSHDVSGNVPTTDNKCGAANTVYTSKRKSESRKATVKRKSKLPRFKKGKGRKMGKSGLLSKKTRKLSSLTGQNKNQDQLTQAVQKPESPVVACIPLRVVFSRINEAVNGLARSAPRVPNATTM